MDFFSARKRKYEINFEHSIGVTAPATWTEHGGSSTSYLDRGCG